MPLRDWVWVLFHKEVCVLRGPSVDDFVRRADRAGALLTAWPDSPTPALLDDAEAWVRRAARRRELLSGEFCCVTEGDGQPHGQPVPTAEIARQYWESTRASPGWGRTVTDDRGNVERWLGFVLYVLKE